MGLKEHIGFRHTKFFSDTFSNMTQLQNTVKDQLSDLFVEEQDIYESEVCFPSFNNNKVLSIVLTSSQVILIPCKKDWKMSEIQKYELIDLISAKIETGKLFKTTLRILKIKDFVRIRLRFKGMEKDLRLFITSDSQYYLGKLFERLQNRFSESQINLQFDEESDEEEVQNGLILLWDYDNIKLSKNGEFKDDYLANRIKAEIDRHGPIIAGWCFFDESLTTSERVKIDMISPLIETSQIVRRKDEADNKLIEKGRELVQERPPTRVMMISEDHIFAEFSKELHEKGVEPVLLHKGRPSLQWLSSGTPITPINLIDIDCRDVKCKEKFSLEEEMEGHFEKGHKPKKAAEFRCGKCLKPFQSTKAVQDHSNKVHVLENLPKYMCVKCNKPFDTELAIQQHKKMKGH